MKNLPDITVLDAVGELLGQQLLQRDARLKALEDRPPPEPGQPGREGTDGKDGDPGPAGKDGEPGKDGLNGIAGKDGEPGTHGKDGAPGDPGPAGIGLDSPAWKAGVHRAGVVVQHHIGQHFRAVADTASEPPGEDWQRLGSGGFRLTGGFTEGRQYEDGDLFVRDFGLFLWHAGEAHLWAGRGGKGDPGLRGVPGDPGKDGKPGLDGAVLEAVEVRGSSMVLVQRRPGGALTELSVDMVPLLEGVLALSKDLSEQAMRNEVPAMVRAGMQELLEASDGDDPAMTPLRRFCGPWAAGRRYARGDAVTMGSGLYLARNGVPAGDVPAAIVNNSGRWLVMLGGRSDGYLGPEGGNGSSSSPAGLPEAPMDGNLYARKDGGWEPIAQPLGEPPATGGPYARQSGEWVAVPTNPNDMGEWRWQTEAQTGTIADGNCGMDTNQIATASYFDMSALNQRDTDVHGFIEALAEGDRLFIWESGNSSNIIRFNVAGPAARVGGSDTYRIPIVVGAGQGADSGRDMDVRIALQFAATPSIEALMQQVQELRARVALLEHPA